MPELIILFNGAIGRLDPNIDYAFVLPELEQHRRYMKLRQLAEPARFPSTDEQLLANRAMVDQPDFPNIDIFTTFAAALNHFGLRATIRPAQ